MKRSTTIFILTLLLLTGCSSEATSSSLPTTALYPGTPTIIIKAPSSTETEQVPTAMISPTVVPSATPVEITAIEQIEITSPLPGATIDNPLPLKIRADSTLGQVIYARLVDLNGDDLGQTQLLQQPGSANGMYTGELKFNANNAQDALLQVYATSTPNSGISHLNSILVKLVPQAETFENTIAKTESIQIDSVKIIQNSGKLELLVSGLASGAFENQLQFKLCLNGSNTGTDFICGSQENIFAAGLVNVKAADMGETGTFDISATLKDGQWHSGTVVVYSLSPANGEVQHASSGIIKNGP